jgi:regulator of protease activity HflC (stomatin/prohibitin superfamily)
MTLPEVIGQTEEVETKLQQEVEKIASKWGVEVVSVDFKDVDIPDTVLQAMHEEKAAEQRKFARMESAEAHSAEIKAVRDAAEQLSDKALAYYYIRALEKIGRGKSTKFIFPMELTRLAEAVSGRVGGTSSSDLEQLFKKYAPAVTNLLSKNELERIKKEAKKK